MQEHHYAVVVGINRYVSLGDLQGPVNDAVTFKRWLTDPGGGDLPEKNVITVEASTNSEAVDAGSVRPSADSIFLAFADLNERIRRSSATSAETREKSRLYGYLAGHGMAPGGEGCAVLMPSAKRNAVLSHVEVQLLANWYAKSGPFKEVLLFADCCREWLPVSACGPPFVELGYPNDRVSVVLGLATEAGELAWEPSSGSGALPVRGHFTTALLSGMRTAADPNGDITVTSLDDYVRQHVQRATDRRQLASVRQQHGPPVVLRRIDPKQTYTVRVHFLADAEALALRDERDAVQEELADAHGGTLWELSLPSGAYWVGPKDFGRGDPQCAFLVEGRDTDVRYPAGTTAD